MTTARMPALFIGHGSPTLAFEDNVFAQGWHRLLADQRPQSVLCISAHWCTSKVAVTAQSRPPTIHDFGGFPPHFYEFQYPAPGEPRLAERVQALLAPTDVVMDDQWGFDHGCWAVLKQLLPHADVPVIQLSLDLNSEARTHYQLGQRLRALRDEGVLIVGSGNVVHNLRRLDFSAPGAVYPWAQRFNDYVRQRIVAEDHVSLYDFSSADANLRSDAALSVPSPDHYLPLLYVLGAAHVGEAVSVVLDQVVMGSISMLSVRVG